jgi:hypothetical protein
MFCGILPRNSFFQLIETAAEDKQLGSHSKLPNIPCEFKFREFLHAV